MLRSFTFLPTLRQICKDNTRLIWALFPLSVAFIIPACVHYWYGEWFMTLLLVIFSIQRCLYPIPKYDCIVNHTLFSAIYSVICVGVLGTIFWHSILYRRDLTSLCMSLAFILYLILGGLLVHLIDKQTLGTDHDFIHWQGLLFVALICNLVWRDMSSPLIMSHFIKGAFWGVVCTLGVQNEVWKGLYNLRSYIEEKNYLQTIETKKQ